MEISDIQDFLEKMDKRKKPKMLVVDDEPDNLDLLYRTFRRNFQVYKASSGLEALEVLSEQGEVAVIISDQRMPEMKGTEFLSKTVPQFPDTVRIILTGFSDVEDLVDAINSGQVYKYITKPWDPNALKNVVQDAADTYDLISTRRLEREKAQIQVNLLMKIIDIVQDAESLEVCLEPIAKAVGQSLEADQCLLKLATENSLCGAEGIYLAGEKKGISLEADPLTEEAIAAGKMHLWAQFLPPDEDFDTSVYEEAGIKLNAVIPIVYKKNLLAVMSLEWLRDHKLQEEALHLMEISSRQIALALTSVGVCG